MIENERLSQCQYVQKIMTKKYKKKDEIRAKMKWIIKDMRTKKWLEWDGRTKHEWSTLLVPDREKINGSNVKREYEQILFRSL